MNPSRCEVVSAATDLIPKILGSTDFAGFLTDSWEAAPSLTRGAAVALSDIVRMDDIEHLIAAGYDSASGTASIVESQMAQRFSACIDSDADWLGSAADSLARGGTLSLTGLHRNLPQVAALCRRFDNTFLSHGVLLDREVFANAYLTPADAQAFGLHYDDHCVVVIQLSGRKHWTVHAPTEVLPTKVCNHSFAGNEMAPPILETELCAGDVLYLPRGFPHTARCLDTASLHLTVGIQSVTWAALLSGMADEIEALRRGVAPMSQDGTPAVAHFSLALAAMQAQLDPSDVLMDRLCHALSRLPPLPGQRLAAATAQPPQLGDTVVRAEHVIVLVRRRQGHMDLFAPGCELSLPAAMQEALEFVAETDRFVVGDIPSGAANFDRAELAAILIRKGVLTPASSAGTPKDFIKKEKEAAYDSL